jgi:hypothetical protein
MAGTGTFTAECQWTKYDHHLIVMQVTGYYVLLTVQHLDIHGVSKKFGEWYQKTNKTEDTINFIGLQNNCHPSQHTVGNVHPTSGNCQQRPL